MTTEQLRRDERLSGTLIVIAAFGAIVLMLHHPSSLAPGNDGLLLEDWANKTVHGGMIAFLLLDMFAFTIVARKLRFSPLCARAGEMAFTIGMAALVIAGLINGFALSDLQAALPDSTVAALQLRTLWILNQVFALFGVALVGSAAALWAKPMLALGRLGRVVAILGIAMAVLAAGWLLLGSGGLSLHAAVGAVAIFALWSLAIAALLLTGKVRS